MTFNCLWPFAIEFLESNVIFLSMTYWLLYELNCYKNNIIRFSIFTTFCLFISHNIIWNIEQLWKGFLKPSWYLSNLIHCIRVTNRYHYPRETLSPIRYCTLNSETVTQTFTIILLKFLQDHYTKTPTITTDAIIISP